MINFNTFSVNGNTVFIPVGNKTTEIRVLLANGEMLENFLSRIKKNPHANNDDVKQFNIFRGIMFEKIG